MASLQSDSTLVLPLVFLVSCLVVLATSFWPGRKHRLPPSPRALPIIGNLHQLGSGHLHRRLHALARRHGPLFLLRLGSVPTIVVSSASLAEAVLKTQDHVFCSRAQSYAARGALYGCRDIAFSPYGDRWRQSRRIAVVHLLSVKRVDSFRALRAQEVAGFVRRIRAACDGAREGRGGVVNVSKLVASLANTVILKAALGNKLGGLEPSMVCDMMKELTHLLERFAVSDVFPRLGWLDWATGLDARVKKTAAKLDGILEGALAEHERSRGDGNGEVRDLLDDLLSIVKDGDQGSKMDRIDAKALILDMFIAGIDTTYKTIEWTMAELLKNPREMAKVQAEVRHVAVGSGGAKLAQPGAQDTGEELCTLLLFAVAPPLAVGTHGGVLEEELEKMIHLHAVVKEALRLMPFLIVRETIEDTQLHGYDIPAKTRVIINTWAIGRDSESWENAEDFRPERFLGRAVDYSGKDTGFIPFGAGRRGCPGAAFATRLVELTLANMMYNFEWELPDDQDPESFEVIESSGLSGGLKSAL